MSQRAAKKQSFAVSGTRLVSKAHKPRTPNSASKRPSNILMRSRSLSRPFPHCPRVTPFPHCHAAAQRPAPHCSSRYHCSSRCHCSSSPSPTPPRAGKNLDIVRLDNRNNSPDVVKNSPVHGKCSTRRPIVILELWHEVSCERTTTCGYELLSGRVLCVPPQHKP